MARPSTCPHGQAVVEFLGAGRVEIGQQAVEVVLREGHGDELQALFEQELAVFGLGALVVAQEVLDFGAGLGRDNVVEPLGRGALLVRGQDFDLVAVVQLVAQGLQLLVDFGAEAVQADLGVDVEGEIQGRGLVGQNHQLALGREGVDLLHEQVLAELVHEFERAGIVGFQHFAHLVHPAFERAFGLNAAGVLVFPVRGVAFLGDVVHAARADLHLHPLAGPRHDGGVQAFVAVGFGRAHPVAQAVGVGLVKVRDDAVYLPAGGFFLLRRHVQNHANGKQIIHLIEGDVLLLHLFQDGVDAFRPAFYLVVKALGFQLLINRLHEFLDEAVAGALALAHLGLDFVVGLGVGEFEVQILQLTLYSVEAKPVGQRRVQIQRFGSDFELLVARHRVQGPHVVQAVGDFDENHAHVFAQA